MKKHIRSAVALLLSLIFILSSAVSVFAAGQPTYSTSANSGERDVICTTLSGTGAEDYYMGSYTYENLSQLSSAALLTSLRNLMTDTHHHISDYDECRDLAIKTDCENGHTSSFVTIYTSYSATKSQYNSGQGWNREHVWPQSLGGFGKSEGGADLHHIRPSESRTNSIRNNNLYGYVSSNTDVKGNLSGIDGGDCSGGYFEPLDNVKGDVARICLYVYVRWGGQYSKCSKITNVFQSIDVLLEWCALDPVDTWEMGRNEVVEKIQGNRNVFIDYPELAWALFGKEAPSDMVTPSGEALDGNTGNGNNNPGTTPGVTPDNPGDDDDVIGDKPGNNPGGNENDGTIGGNGTISTGSDEIADMIKEIEDGSEKVLILIYLGAFDTLLYDRLS